MLRGGGRAGAAGRAEGRGGGDINERITTENKPLIKSL